MPAGRSKFRDGPVRVAKLTVQVSPSPAHSVEVVRTYQLIPASIRPGAASHSKVPKGSKAAGQPLGSSATSAPSRSGWPQSVPLSSTAAVEPLPVKPLFQASVKLWLRASRTFSLRYSSKVEPRGGGAWA